MLTVLKLGHFRCFERLEMQLQPGVNAFIGANAQGKTTILEAICVLLRLQSPRATVMSEMVRFGEAGFGVSGRWEDRELSVVWRRGKRLFLNGAEVSTARDYLAGSGYVVWMGNEDADLVGGSGVGRRRYLDFLGSQLLPEYRGHWLAYEKARRSRNQLFQSERQQKGEIEAYGQVMVRHGQALTAMRRELLDLLNPHVAAAHAAICAERERFRLEYVDGSGPDFAAALAAAWEADLNRGQTTVGPHRDDLRLLLEERPANKFASEGQRRTLALALKLAQVETLRGLKSRPPILLIDDVFGELDADRRAALLRALPPDAQKVITTTSTAWLPEHRELEPVLFRVEDGRVSN